MRGYKTDHNSPRMEKDYTNQGSFPTMNRTVRVMTAVLLTMMLSGCLGAGDTAEDGSDGGGGLIPTAQGTSTTVVNGNYLPIANAHQVGPLTENVTYVSANSSGVLQGMNVSVYHSALDPDGSTLAMGWDLNLDGTIDVPVSNSQGFTIIYIPISDWNVVPGTDNNSHMVSVAFYAIDANGGKDVALLDLHSRIPAGPWWMNSGLYAMSGKDAQGTPGTGTADNLIMLTMDQGGDINWAAVSVKLSIDGAAPVTCDNPGVDGTSVCSLVEFGNTDDQVWSVGDGVTVVENGQELCSGSCSIDVTVTDTREGKTIDTTNGVVAE
jgi:hypothetical protein